MSCLEAPIERLDEARSEYFELLNTFSHSEGLWKPSNDEWSAAEITEHLYWAELGVSNHMWKQFSDMREGVAPVYEPSANHGLSFSEIVASHGNCIVDAPRQTLPRIKGPLVFWKSVLGGLRSAYHRLEIEITQDEASCFAFDHVIFGRLDFYQTLDFLSSHITRHKGQVHRLLDKM